MRVHELAKELGKSSKDVITVLEKSGVEGKTHSSSLEPDQISQVKKELSSSGGGRSGRSRPTPRPPRPTTSPGAARAARTGGSPTAATGGRSTSDRQSRVQRMLIQRKLARRQQTSEKKKKEEVQPEPEITIQVIEEKEAEKKTDHGRPAPGEEKKRAAPPKKEAATKERPGRRPEKVEKKVPDITEMPAPPTEEEERRKGDHGHPSKKKKGKKAGDEKKQPSRRHAPKGKGREKDETREVIDESLEIAKVTAPAKPSAPATQRPFPAGPRRPPMRRPAGPRRGGGRRRKYIRKEQRERREQQMLEQQRMEEEASRIVTVHETTTVADLAEQMHMGVTELISKLMGMGVFAAKNQQLDRDTLQIVCDELDFEIRESSLLEDPSLFGEEEKDDPESLENRPPVVTIMGHVDHGKTKLLDAVRNSNIVDGEAGGITQHIGAYDVRMPNGRIVFLDTPGHEAFTAMRARGAMVTDLVVLVVAADDGVMPQTVEAIHHAKAADVPIVVAVNKIDKEGADPKRVLSELGQHGLLPEEWGGKTQVVQISALQREGISDLLERLLLESEILELKANPNRRARGTIIEGQMDPGRGPVATVLVEKGTLEIGDSFVAGIHSGKVRALINDHGEEVEKATPATPVEVLGIEGVPSAGDPFLVVPDEKSARQISLKLQQNQRARELKKIKHISLEELHLQITEGAIKELNIIVKADVQGSVGAIMDALGKIPQDKVKTTVIHSGVGTVSESDVMLASASNALILGFNIRPNPAVEELAKQEGVNIRTYRVIYDAIADIKAALEGMLESKYKEVSLGRCEIREVFRADRNLVVAGGYVTSGKLQRNARLRILRDDVVVHEGKLDSLRRFKEDVREVAQGYECGVGITNYSDVKAGDFIECYDLEEVKQTLEN